MVQETSFLNKEFVLQQICRISLPKYESTIKVVIVGKVIENVLIITENINEMNKASTISPT